MCLRARSHSIAPAPPIDGDQRGQHRREPEQVAGRDAGERDVADPVSDQAELPLDEEEADRGREQADDRARGEREPHELEVKHGRATGRARGRGAALRRTVEDDAAADEDEPLDEALDRAELVRDVEDGDRSSRWRRSSRPGERLLRLDVDPGRRLVQHEQRRLGGERLRDERPLLLAARERAQRHVGALGQPDPLDRLGDDRAVAAAQRAEQAAGREPARGDDLAHGRRRVDAELRALGEVAERGAAREPRRRLAEEERLARRRPLEPERQPHQRRLAAAVRTGDRDELARLDGELDVLEHRPAAVVGERDVAQLDRYRHPRAFRSAARFSRMTEK